jgi:hypothetical protein
MRDMGKVCQGYAPSVEAMSLVPLIAFVVDRYIQDEYYDQYIV